MSTLSINVQKPVEEKNSGSTKKLGSKITTLASFWEKSSKSSSVKTETVKERNEELEKLRKTESISNSINAFKTLERRSSKGPISSPVTEKEPKTFLLSFAKNLGLVKKEEKEEIQQPIVEPVNDNVTLEKTSVKTAKEQLEVKIKNVPKKQSVNQWKELLEENPPVPIIEALNGAIKYNDIPPQELLKTYRDKSESFIGQHEHFLTMTNPFYHFERDVPGPPPKNLFKKHDFVKWEKEMENKLIKFI